MFKIGTMLPSKRGNFDISKVTGVIVGIVVLFLLLAQLVPEGQSAGDQLNQSGVPLGGLFAGSGVLWLIVMAGILIGVIAVANKMLKGGK